MRQIEIVVESYSTVEAADVFRLLRDGATWPQWSLFNRFELEQEGSPDRLGVGAVRVFSTRVSRAREEIVESVPGRKLSYILLSGLPLETYRADVDLIAAHAGGTTICWRCWFRPRHRALVCFWRWLMTRTLREVGRQLARAAEDPAMVAATAAAGE